MPGPSLWCDHTFQSFLIIQHWATVFQTWRTVYRDEDDRKGRWMKNTHKRKQNVKKRRESRCLREAKKPQRFPPTSKRWVCPASTPALPWPSSLACSGSVTTTSCRHSEQVMPPTGWVANTQEQLDHSWPYNPSHYCFKTLWTSSTCQLHPEDHFPMWLAGKTTSERPGC